jgi:hypothetical protein
MFEFKGCVIKMNFNVNDRVAITFSSVLTVC